jgi:hypothetical protein
LGLCAVLNDGNSLVTSPTYRALDEKSLHLAELPTRDAISAVDDAAARAFARHAVGMQIAAHLQTRAVL